VKPERTIAISVEAMTVLPDRRRTMTGVEIEIEFDLDASPSSDSAKVYRRAILVLIAAPRGHAAAQLNFPMVTRSPRTDVQPGNDQLLVAAVSAHAALEIWPSGAKERYRPKRSISLAVRVETQHDVVDLAPPHPRKVHVDPGAPTHADRRLPGGGEDVTELAAPVRIATGGAIDAIGSIS
jgi:hypothetical protein